MVVKALKAISKTTGFLAKALDKSQKTTEEVLKKEYLYNISQFLKEKSGDIIEKVGYATGKVEEIVDKATDKTTKSNS